MILTPAVVQGCLHGKMPISGRASAAYACDAWPSLNASSFQEDEIIQ
jgi:hypothetical protein